MRMGRCEGPVRTRRSRCSMLVRCRTGKQGPWPPSRAFPATARPWQQRKAGKPEGIKPQYLTVIVDRPRMSAAAASSPHARTPSTSTTRSVGRNIRLDSRKQPTRPRPSRKTVPGLQQTQRPIWNVHPPRPGPQQPAARQNKRPFVLGLTPALFALFAAYAPRPMPTSISMPASISAR